MSKQYIDNLTFKGFDYSKDHILKGEYENCAFANCNFAGVDLSQIGFTECLFSDSLSFFNSSGKKPNEQSPFLKRKLKQTS